MTVETIVLLALLGVSVISGVVSLIVALAKGEVKKFIEEKMVEAEKSGKTGKEKLAYVLEAVDEKYKVMKLFMNAKKFIEHIIDLSKQINSK